MWNRLNMPYMGVKGNQTTRKTSVAAQTKDGTYRQTFFYCCFGVVGG